GWSEWLRDYPTGARPGYPIGAGAQDDPCRRADAVGKLDAETWSGEERPKAHQEARPEGATRLETEGSCQCIGGSRDGSFGRRYLRRPDFPAHLRLRLLLVRQGCRRSLVSRK